MSCWRVQWWQRAIVIYVTLQVLGRPCILGRETTTFVFAAQILNLAHIYCILFKRKAPSRFAFPRGNSSACRVEKEQCSSFRFLGFGSAQMKWQHQSNLWPETCSSKWMQMCCKIDASAMCWSKMRCVLVSELKLAVVKMTLNMHLVFCWKGKSLNSVSK